eukprot:415453-Pelagomonas_calceolata.AAC.2
MCPSACIGTCEANKGLDVQSLPTPLLSRSAAFPIGMSGLSGTANLGMTCGASLRAIWVRMLQCPLGVCMPSPCLLVVHLLFDGCSLRMCQCNDLHVRLKAAAECNQLLLSKAAE